ncbi:MAG TPA: NUDIX domain-containing protein [Stackebrandtia sp.]|jgi:8-oxo-dGTP pyrophosphatase MutT (NUDIX family)|uniref:NUDIX hydrolase n=1 Tax=Stackebrandtia sp. TaxID=2023065 RepID=UPI002D70E531|nr:NUDIX domain-containing protein [Stackebrandtia sp.]HZE39744.1 NUDIX domain-containing protein [Stackebrandtia sp.]
MSQASVKSASRAKAFAYKVFYRLPKMVRRRIVRIATPTYTVGAVMLVYSLDESQVLLLNQPPGFGWGLPAGLIERGERPEAAAVRELSEETGIALTLDDITAAAPAAVVHTRGRWVDVVFTAHLDPERVDLVVDGAEVLDAKWWPVDAFPPITVAASRLLAHYGLGPYADYPVSARVD